jgi:hypothetical protein
MDDLLCISNDGEIRIVRYENDLAPFLGLLDERDQYFVNALVVKVVFRLVDNQWDKRRMLMEIGSMFAETTREPPPPGVWFVRERLPSCGMQDQLKPVRSALGRRSATRPTGFEWLPQRRIELSPHFVGAMIPGPAHIQSKLGQGIESFDFRGQQAVPGVAGTGKFAHDFFF